MTIDGISDIISELKDARELISEAEMLRAAIKDQSQRILADVMKTIERVVVPALMDEVKRQLPELIGKDLYDYKEFIGVWAKDAIHQELRRNVDNAFKVHITRIAEGDDEG